MIGGPGLVTYLVAVGSEAGVSKAEFSESNVAVEITSFAKIASIIAQPFLNNHQGWLKIFTYSSSRTMSRIMSRTM